MKKEEMTTKRLLLLTITGLEYLQNNYTCEENAILFEAIPEIQHKLLDIAKEKD